MTFPSTVSLQSDRKCRWEVLIQMLVLSQFDLHYLKYLFRVSERSWSLCLPLFPLEYNNKVKSLFFWRPQPPNLDRWMTLSCPKGSYRFSSCPWLSAPLPDQDPVHYRPMTLMTRMWKGSARLEDAHFSDIVFVYFFMWHFEWLLVDVHLSVCMCRKMSLDLMGCLTLSEARIWWLTIAVRTLNWRNGSDRQQRWETMETRKVVGEGCILYLHHHPIVVIYVHINL